MCAKKVLRQCNCDICGVQIDRRVGGGYNLLCMYLRMCFYNCSYSSGFSFQAHAYGPHPRRPPPRAVSDRPRRMTASAVSLMAESGRSSHECLLLFILLSLNSSVLAAVLPANPVQRPPKKGRYPSAIRSQCRWWLRKEMQKEKSVSVSGTYRCISKRVQKVLHMNTNERRGLNRAFNSVIVARRNIFCRWPT